ncbi:MAG: sensor histidine kinase [Kiritimatiellia bacterium]
MVAMLMMIPFPTVAPTTEIEQSTVVTAVVSHAFANFRTAAIVVSENDPDGEAVFISGNLPGKPPGELIGAQTLKRGDRVEISGRLSPMLFEPGIIVAKIVRLGHIELPPARLVAIGEVNSAAMNNRRVRIRGILTSAAPRVTEWGGRLTLLTVASRDGEVAVRVSAGATDETRPPATDYTRHIGSEIEVEGVCMASFNSRREFLHSEIETRGEELVRVLPGAPPGPQTLTDEGILGWQNPQSPFCPFAITGTVTLKMPDEGCFILQTGEHAYAIYPEDPGNLPSPGAAVEATGFPCRRDHCGALHHARVARASGPVAPVAPLAIDLDDLTEIEEGAIPMTQDYYHRLVTVKGRASLARSSGDGGLCFELAESRPNCRVRLPAGATAELLERLEDAPLVELTGVLDLRLARSSVSLRFLSIAEIDLVLRDADDITIVPDAAYRLRRLRRCGLALAPALLIASLAAVVLLLLRRRSERMRKRAIAADRRRIAAELHDTISQHLAGVKMVLDNFRRSAPPLDDAQHEALAAAGEMIDLSRREIRNAINDLHSEELLSKSLGELLRIFAARLQAANPDIRIAVKTAALPHRLASETKRALLAVFQEGATNAIRHGGASELAIELRQLGRHGYEATLADNGKAFDPERSPGAESGHYGLDNMRERAEHGRFTIRREQIAGGNLLVLRGLAK